MIISPGPFEVGFNEGLLLPRAESRVESGAAQGALARHKSSFTKVLGLL